MFDVRENPRKLDYGALSLHSKEKDDLGTSYILMGKYQLILI